MMRKFVTLAFALSLPMPLAAVADTGRPESCVLAATAQFDNCSVANTFRCTGEDIAFWIETLDADAAMTVETRNSSHGSMSLEFVGQGAAMRISQSEAHPRDTIRKGSAEDRIVGEFEFFGMKRTITGETVYGYAGETTEIAGENFARINFTGSITFPSPMPVATASGTFLYSDRLDLLIEESVNMDSEMAGDSYQLLHLALPGEAGFGDEQPRHGCGELSFLSLGKREEAA